MLVFIPISLSDFAEYGNDDGLFNTINGGFWNENLVDDLTTGAKALTNPQTLPLIGDMDGDGINEIILIDSNTFIIFQGQTLSVVDVSLSLPSSGEYSNPILFDIDNDGFLEYIIASQDNQDIFSISFNGTHLTNTSVSYIPMPAGTGSEMVLKCGEFDRCVASGGQIGQAGGTYFAFWFNDTAIGSQTKLHQGHPSEVVRNCPNAIRYMPYTDSDRDGINEYHYSGITLFATSTQDVLFAGRFSVNSSHNITSEMQINTTLFNTGTPANCTSGAEFVTAPAVYDYDDNLANGIEIAVGMQTSATEFAIDVYNKDGDKVDDFPELLQPDGVLISNLFVGDFFPDTITKGKDVCVLGSGTTSNDIIAICGTENQPIGFTETSVREINNDFFNLTDDGNKFYNHLAMATQQSSILEDGENLDEISSSYGIFSIDTSGVDDTLNLIFRAPYENGALLMSDTENNARTQMLIMTTTNLIYQSDSFVNSPANINGASSSIDPCLDSTLKLNTSLSLSVVVNDPDSDTVRAKAILYDGTIHAQDTGYSSYVASDTPIVFSLTANVTTPSAILKIVANDFENNLTNDTLSLPFSVSVNGVSQGECSQTLQEFDSDEVVTEVEADFDDTNLANNSFQAVVQQVSDVTNLGGAVVWFLISLGVVVTLFFVSKDMGEEHPRMFFGALAFIFMMFQILGVFLGLVSTGLIITVVIIGLMVAVAFTWKYVSGSGSI